MLTQSRYQVCEGIAMGAFGIGARLSSMVGKRRSAAMATAGLLICSASVLAATAAPTVADTLHYFASCKSSVLGNFVATGIVTTGTLSSNPVAPGGGETLNGYGISATLPASAVNAALGQGITSLTGTITTSIDATNISPASTPETLDAATGTLVANTPATVTTTPLATAPTFTGAAASGVVYVAQDSHLTVEFSVKVDGVPVTVTAMCTTGNTINIYTAAIVSPTAPQITSAASDTVLANGPFSYNITTTGTPIPAISVASGSTLPSGVTLTDNGNRSATLASTASITPGRYTFTLQAANGVSADATQLFTLTADQAPSFTSPARVTFRAGVRHIFTVRTAGYPVARISKSGKLPRGLKFQVRSNGTAVLSGVAAHSTKGTFRIVLTASNGIGTAARQVLIIRVK
jgi:hypothetical protein